MLMMVGTASEPIRRGIGAVVISVYLSFVLIVFHGCFCKSRKNNHLSLQIPSIHKIN